MGECLCVHVFCVCVCMRACLCSFLCLCACGYVHACVHADVCLCLHNNRNTHTSYLRQSWKKNNNKYEAATTETFAKANVVIDGPGLESPTTWMYRDCGEPGEFIQIPIKVMTGVFTKVTDIFGSPGKPVL